MAYVVERTLVHGTRFMGMYLDPEGHKRSAGSFSTRREAQRAAHREEQTVLAGAWHDTSLGDITFQDFVESEWLPHKHLETSSGPRLLRLGGDFKVNETPSLRAELAKILGPEALRVTA